MDIQLAYPVKNFAKAVGFSEKHIRRQIAAGKLVARRSGRKQTITADEGKRWLTSLPTTGEAAAA
jgi:hypothetical protein